MLRGSLPITGEAHAIARRALWCSYNRIVLTPQARRQITDVFHRPLRSLRLSVTDRCNLRCQYCGRLRRTILAAP